MRTFSRLAHNVFSFFFWNFSPEVHCIHVLVKDRPPPVVRKPLSVDTDMCFTHPQPCCPPSFSFFFPPALRVAWHIAGQLSASWRNHATPGSSQAPDRWVKLLYTAAKRHKPWMTLNPAPHHPCRHDANFVWLLWAVGDGGQVTRLGLELWSEQQCSAGASQKCPSQLQGASSKSFDRNYRMCYFAAVAVKKKKGKKSRPCPSLADAKSFSGTDSFIQEQVSLRAAINDELIKHYVTQEV